MLTVYAAPDAGLLIHDLARGLSAPPGDVFAPEVVAVHSRGSERWISQQLSHHLGADPADGAGVCAGILYPPPRAVIEMALDSFAPAPGAERWHRDRLPWEAAALLADGAQDEPWAQPLVARCGSASSGKRIASLTAATRLLDSYTLQRPDMVLRWLEGENTDGVGHPLSDAQRWQAELLRALHRRIGAPTTAERCRDTIEALRAGRVDRQTLPERMAFFSFTALPLAHLAVLTALGINHDVSLLVLHPSPALWRRGPTGRAVAPTTSSETTGPWPTLGLRAQTELPDPGHPLLASWGRDTRELRSVLDALPDVKTVERDPDPVDGRTNTLLSALQGDIRADAAPRDVVRAPDDRSIQVHAAPGKARQVQALRDVLLAMLAEDSTLQPRDIVVMCPQVESFAPHITAHLSLTGVVEDAGDEQAELRVRLADRSLRQANPLLALLSMLLDLASARMTATQLLDLVAAGPVRRRFGFDDDDLDRLDTWIRESGMRWGLDNAHRSRLGVDAGEVGTLWQGLRRLLLGIALPQGEDEDNVVGGVAPYDDVEGTETVLAGRMAELLSRLQQIVEQMNEPRPAAEWERLLLSAVDQLGRADPATPWQRTQVVEVTAELGRTAGGVRAAVTVDDIRLVLADALRGQPSRENHRSGDLTVCTLVPMRSVPHRVVALLGMDDGAFPRRTHHAVDDLAAAHERVADRDPRTEDRQLLLDAIMSARDAVIVTYDGSDERSGETRPPAVPIAELLDVLDDMGDGAGKDTPPLSQQVTTIHPLRPYAPEVFSVAEGDAATAPRPPAFDQVAHAGAARLLQAAAGSTAAAAPVPTPIPPADRDPVISSDDLIGMLLDPAAQFLRQRLSTWAPRPPSLPEDDLPAELWGLSEWVVGEALLTRRALDDESIQADVVARLDGESLIPPVGMVDHTIERIAEHAADVVAYARTSLRLDEHPPEAKDIDTTVGGRRLVGAVAGVRNHRIVRLSYSKIRPRHQLRVWIELLLLTAAHPETPWTGCVVGRDEERDSSYRGYPPKMLGFPPLAPDVGGRRQVAADLLAQLIEVYDGMLDRPAVLPPTCGMVIAESRARAEPDVQRLQSLAAAWSDGWDSSPDCASAHRLLLGGVQPIEHVLSWRPEPGMERLADTIYGPLVAHRHPPIVPAGPADAADGGGS